MNKQDIIKTVAANLEVTQKDATKYVDAVFATIKDAMADGESVNRRLEKRQNLRDVILRLVKQLWLLLIKHRNSRQLLLLKRLFSNRSVVIICIH